MDNAATLAKWWRLDAKKKKTPARTNMNLKLSKRARARILPHHNTDERVCPNVTQDVAVNRKQIKSSARIRYLAASSN